MPVLNLRNESSPETVQVPVAFIDRYMSQASGEFVKVYLALLRHINNPGASLTISGLADSLNHTEGDVMRALKYWERIQLLRLDYAADQTLSGITLLDMPGSGENFGSAAQETAAAAVSAGKMASAGPSLLKKLESDEEFKRFIFVAGQYLGTPLNRKDCDTFAYLYEELHMPAELLEYVIESCISMGHRSVRYIETVALDLHKRGILTVEQAKTALPAIKKDSYAVMKAFGLNSRQPAPGEKTMMDKWFSSYGFTLDLVLEACSRTISAIHSPSFEYADKILESWKEHGVQSMKDVQALDERHSQGKNRKPSRTVPGRSAARPNQFHNFEQRDYDFDELMKQLNQQ